GDVAHNRAWEILHQARDVARRAADSPGNTHSPRTDMNSEPEHDTRHSADERSLLESPGLALDANPTPTAASSFIPVADSRPGQPPDSDTCPLPLGLETQNQALQAQQAAWRHVLIAEGSDWFWWFGEHHRTELDAAWDLAFRRHLQEVYCLLGASPPPELFAPLLPERAQLLPAPPRALFTPEIDGVVDPSSEWDNAGILGSDIPATMARTEGMVIREARFGWDEQRFYILVIPRTPSALAQLQAELLLFLPGSPEVLLVRLALAPDGKGSARCEQHPDLADSVELTWKDVLEVAIPWRGLMPTSAAIPTAPATIRVILRLGKDGLMEHVFHSVGMATS
ncbi:MAG: hypothetical protein H5T84_06535, partial [Thermoleophilia bacterium]|nr:hypothetical protein [Thermoleophilia bacterium]